MSKNDERNSDEFCNFPFLQMLLQPTGVVSPCCWNQEIVLGDVRNNTIEEIWNGEPAQKLRREFLEGKPVSCRTQMNHVGCHHFSRRPHFESELTYAEIIPTAPRRLDVRLNGKCNLQCTMCDVWQQPNGVYDNANFWPYAEKEIFPYLKEMDVLGGEPFVQKDTFRLIDQIHAVNPQCSWAFVTNGQYVLGPAILSRLEKIPIRWMQMSIDSVDPETYKKVRIGGTLDKPLKSLDGFLQLKERKADRGEHYNFLLSMCVQKMNWRGIREFIEFALEKKCVPILQFAYQPADVSLLALEEAERKEILFDLTVLRGQFGPCVDPILLPVKESIALVECIQEFTT